MAHVVPKREAIRKGDTLEARLAPGEVVVPKGKVTPGLIELLGKDRVAGHPSGPVSEFGRELFFEGTGEEDEDEGKDPSESPSDNVGSSGADDSWADFEAEALDQAGGTAGGSGFGGIGEAVDVGMTFGLSPLDVVLGLIAPQTLFGKVATTAIASIGRAAGIPDLATFNTNTGFASPALDSLTEAFSNPADPTDVDELSATGLDGVSAAAGPDAAESLEAGAASLIGDPSPNAFGKSEGTPETPTPQRFLSETFGSEIGDSFNTFGTDEFDILDSFAGLRPELAQFAQDTTPSDFQVPTERNIRFDPATTSEDVDRFILEGVPSVINSANEGEAEQTQPFTTITPEQFDAFTKSNAERSREIANIKGQSEGITGGFNDAIAALEGVISGRGLEGQGFGMPSRLLIEQIANQFPINVGQDPSLRLSTDIGTEITERGLLNARNARRGDLQTEAEGLFGDAPLGFDFDDAIIDQILNTRQTAASGELAKQSGIGNLNVEGSRLANEALLAQRPGAAERLGQIGDAQLGLRNELFNPIRQDAFSAAQGFELGDDFSFDPFNVRADEFRTDAAGGLKEDILTQLGGEPLFNRTGAFQTGAGGQGLVSGGSSTNATPAASAASGASAGPPGTGISRGSANLLDAFAGRTDRRSEERGLRNVGSGRF